MIRCLGVGIQTCDVFKVHREKQHLLMDETVKPLRVPPHMAEYADKHDVFHLLQSMLSSLLVDQPEDPIGHLTRLLQRTNVDIPRVLVLGPPAVGKHTVATKLSAELRAVHVTTESLLQDQSERSIQRDQGKLVDPLTGDAYHETFVLPPHRSVARRLEAPSPPEGQREAELQRHRSEVTGLSSAYQHVLKVVNADQPHADVYHQEFHGVQVTMSSADDQLSLNICTSVSSSSSRRKPPTSQQRWAMKKQKAEKRRSGSSNQRVDDSDEEEEEEEEDSQTDQRTPQKKRRRKEAVQEKRSIQTSSLFKHNPEIPEMLRPVVSQLKEKIFSSDSFSDMDLHPHLAVQQKVCRSDGPLAVVIVPTREVSGPADVPDLPEAPEGINILVSTPGRLVDHIKNTLSIAFSGVRWLVLDEADRTLDLGFEKDLTVILNSLNSAGPSRQNVLLSATLTHGVTRLAGICLNDPVDIQVSGPASCDLSSAVTSDLSADSQPESFALPEALKQYVLLVPSKLRLVCLAAFILDKCKFSQNNKLIVFTSSCEAVEFLHGLFTSVLAKPSSNQKPRLSFLRLHGNMKQAERSEVFQQFSVSPSGVLLCTYTPPTTATEYVHRVGRTARIGGRGSSLLFLTPAETAFIPELANHNISLEELKLQDILSSLMMDDTYKGRGKYHSKASSKALEQETRERATVLQTEFENFVHLDAESVQNAKRALQSFLRAYTAYPTRLKHIFHIRSLHLGHAAKSFGLRDAPQDLIAPSAPRARTNNKNQNHKKGTSSRPAGAKRLNNRQMLHSEFSSGLEGAESKKKRKKKKKVLGQLGEEEEEE
ncbi:putative ATP-dependent RNA helicase DDX31 [Liparis tanakae]|uniref:ATP-dependent RNA helicase n=1 Tax=Liparis tanakae TaxID=230148 RepID=A0A4Z2GQ31_9TELE|nr:putative ATP-dependent RNA helicase DDX31 [Liparis tanakae]